MSSADSTEKTGVHEDFSHLRRSFLKLIGMLPLMGYCHAQSAPLPAIAGAEFNQRERISRSFGKSNDMRNYSILYPGCGVREAMSTLDLLRMKKARDQANTALNWMRIDPTTDKSKPESEWVFKVAVPGASGSKTTEIRIGDLLAESEPLEALAHHCRNCPASVLSRDFSCSGIVHYPITMLGEQWLVSKLPADLDSEAGHFLLRAITDFDYRGVKIDAKRNRKERYEADKPPERKWSSGLSKTITITSSQILEMAFGVGDYLEPPHATMVAYFLGFVGGDSPEPGDPLHLPLSNNPLDYPQPEDDECIIELKSFLLAMAWAGVNRCLILVKA